MSSTVAYFNYDAVELAGQLTRQTHNTLAWLVNNDYITQDQDTELTESLIVTAIPNKPSFGQRVLARFFNKKSDEASWVFPIVQIDNDTRNMVAGNEPKKGKPTLEVVK